jgi:hypothetical protein
MRLDENAAAFGLFHLAYANLTQALARAVWLIKRVSEPSVQFERVFSLTFSQLLKALREQLEKHGGSASADPNVQSLLDVGTKIEVLAAWRNARAHPLVQIDHNGITLYDWRTRKPLSVGLGECMEKIQQSIGFGCELDSYAGGFVGSVRSDKVLHEMIDEAFKTAERLQREQDKQE